MKTTLALNTEFIKSRYFYYPSLNYIELHKFAFLFILITYLRSLQVNSMLSSAQLPLYGLCGSNVNLLTFLYDPCCENICQKNGTSNLRNDMFIEWRRAKD